MRSTRRLRTLYCAATKCWNRLRTEVDAINRHWSPRQVEVQMCRVTIDTHNTWVNFVRAYYLSAAFGAKRLHGPRIKCGTPGLSEAQAIENAIITWRPRLSRRIATGGRWHRREEPTWHDHRLLLSICAAETFSNLTEMQTAFSAGYRVFDDLPIFRNYFAHRNRGTLDAATALAPRYGIPATRRPSEILLHRPIKRPQALILEWIDELEFTAEYLCD